VTFLVFVDSSDPYQEPKPKSVLKMVTGKREADFFKLTKNCQIFFANKEKNWIFFKNFKCKYIFLGSYQKIARKP